jgi:asparagine synthase (glutamine-hydrolysing)
MLPVAYWLQGSSLQRVEETLELGPLVQEGWIAPGAAGRLVAEHQQGRADHHVRLWMLLNLDVWSRLYLKLEGGGAWPEEMVRAAPPTTGTTGRSRPPSP